MKRRLDINSSFQLPRLPHFAAGSSIQQLTTKARKMMTWVHHGVTNKLLELLKLAILDQSSVRFKKPIPPKPEPMKFATLFFGATQQRNAKEPSIGNTNSGRNCHKVIPARTPKNTLICFFETRDGCCLCFFWVSNRAVWQSLLKFEVSDNHSLIFSPCPAVKEQELTLDTMGIQDHRAKIV